MEQDILKRLEELIQRGKRFKEKSQEIVDTTFDPGIGRWGPDDSLVFKQWKICCVDFLRRAVGDHLAGEFSSLEERCRVFEVNGERVVEPLDSAFERWLDHYLAVLYAAEEIIRKGLVIRRLQGLIAADLFSSVLEQADHLLVSGFKDPAAVLGRIVLEKTLRHLAERERVGNPAQDKASRLNDELRKAGLYPQPVWRQVQVWLDIGNSAAHGAFDNYDESQVSKMLEWIREFAKEHLAAESGGEG